MNPTKQRIAIAEACGWLNVVEDGAFRAPLGRPRPTSNVYLEVPDYLNDLNVMHAAEETLTDGQAESYLRRLVGFDFSDDSTDATKAVALAAFATAAQRAEAFLKTIGKWEDE